MNRKANFRNVNALIFAGLTFSLASQGASGAAGTCSIKKVGADQAQEIVVEFGGTNCPAAPQLLDLPGPNHRLIIDFAEASIDKGSLPSAEELSRSISRLLPFVKAMRYQELGGPERATARIVLDLPEDLKVNPHLVKVGPGVAVVALSDGPIAYTPANANAQSESAAQQSPEPESTIEGTVTAPSAAAGSGKIKLPDGSVVNAKVESVRRYNQAVQFHLSGKLNDAIASYKEALEVNTQLAEAHSNLGLIYNQQHNYAQALSEFRKALAINPKDAITYNGIGAALRAEHDLQGAIKNWQTAVSLDQKLATAHYNLGTAYEIEKDFDKALNSYREAVKNDYRLGEAYYRMGLILEVRKHRGEEAVEQYKESLKISSDSEYSEDARQRLVYLQSKKGKTQ